MDKTPAPQSKRLGCCGAIEKAKNEVRDKKARRNQPQPWIVLKFTVVLTFGILGYATYVYIGRVCLPMINEQGGASGSRTMGIAFLVVHCVLLAMVLWSYIKVVMTSPGKAKEHIEHSDRPRDASSQDHQDHDDDGNAIGGRSYEDITAMQQSETQRSVASSTLPGHAPPPLPVALPSQPPPQGNGVAPEKDINTGVLDAIPGAGHTDIEAQSPASASRRRPHMNPVLAPEFRYCGRDKLVKPPRAHHCRACATCILQYDHHCPWIGQCVGARNHKFFVNFLFWCIPYTYFLLATIIAINTPASGPQSTVDPQQIVIAALAGLFGLFTTTLLMTHVRLIMLNTTTVESLQIRSNQERETAQLNLMHGWWNFSAKKRTRKQWDQEWGHPHMEGNLWWLGSTRRNWEAKMGKSPFEWFFPIGHSESDGLSYPTNPRFDELGRQRRRKFWPLET